MKFWDLIKIANRNLTRSKLRTFLTVTAVFIGSITLVMTNGLGDGLRSYIENQVKNIEGSNVLFVRKKFEAESDKTKNGGSSLEYKETSQDEAGNLIDPNSTSISLGQMEALARELPEVKTVTPSYRMDGEYITLDGGGGGGGSKKFQLELGMLSEGIIQKTEAGKTIDGENQIVIPLSLAREMDQNINNLVGRTATIAYKVNQNAELRTATLKIVGVATKGFIANFNSFVDSKTARRIYEDQNRQSNYFNQFQNFSFQLNTSDEREIAEIKKRLDAKNLVAESLADQKKRTYDGIAIFKTGMNFFAFIALLAASFGIINTLVIAVLERTKEIGLQKALGMGRGKVFLLFSLESVLIGFWGAALGVAGGMIIGVIANVFLARTFLESFEGYSLFVFTPQSIVFVMLLVCLIAFLAGVLPALRASRLNPIEALRYE